jgi:VWFA-related protein
MPVRARTLVCLIGLAAIGLGAQSPTPSQGQPPKFRSDTRLVRISVVVHDRRGRPVDGLTADDFRLLDRGTEQTIALFDVERRTVAPDAVKPSAPGALDAKVFSNAIRGPAAGGVTVVLFDRLNTAFSAQVQARAHIFKYLSQVKPTEPVALYVLDSSAVRVVHDFTRDTSSLLRALDRVQGRTSLETAAASEPRPQPSDSGDAATDAMIDAALTSMDAAVKAFYLANRAQYTLDALEAIARHLAGIEGRKNLIWVSAAFPVSFTDGLGGGMPQRRSMYPEVKHAARAITDADVAVYPVDARGLVGTLTTPPALGVDPAFTTISTTMPAVDTMRLTADLTGGRAYYNTNDLGGAIARAVDDSQLLYVLGYYPPSGSWDGKFHEVKVTTRRPDLDVRHRTGYLALPSLPQDVETRQQAILRALSSPFDASGLPLTVTAEPVVGGALMLAMRIDTRALLFLADGDLGTASVDVTIAQALSDGSLLRVLDVNVPLRFTREMRAQADREGVVLKRQIDVRDDARELRIAVRDPASGMLGTVTIPAAQARAIAIQR